MASCVPKYMVEKFAKDVRSGKVNVDKLMKAKNSEARRDILRLAFEDKANLINADVEKALTLKNKEAGVDRWLQKAQGLAPDGKPLKETDRSMQGKIQRAGDLLTPENEDAYLEDLVARKLGMAISPENTSKLFELSNKLEEKEVGTIPYGEAFIELNEFMKEAKIKRKLTAVESIMENTAEAISTLTRGIKTAFDVSALGRQGGAYIGTKEWRSAAKNLVSGPLGGQGYIMSEEAMRDLKIRVYSSPHAKILLKNAKHLGLTMFGDKLSDREEASGSKFNKSIPLISHSTRAYEGFLNDLRSARMETLLNEFDALGDHPLMNDAEMQADLAKSISAATGRGSLGPAEKMSSSLATILFSPKWVASRYLFVANPIIKRDFSENLLGKATPASIEARKALGRTMGLAASLMGLALGASLLTDEDDDLHVEVDPRSSDFGKVKVGNVRFDVTLGLGAYITLLTRLLPTFIPFMEPKTKDLYTGKVKELSGRQRTSLLTAFGVNKSSPLTGVMVDYFRGHDFNYNDVSDQSLGERGKYLFNALVTPLIASETIEAYKESTDGKVSKEVMAALAFGAGQFGISTSSYKVKPKKKKKKKKPYKPFKGGLSGLR
tara:strand:- start:6165 stop:7988 length:1824 start_codon:yes stop_codon:yes gene_type:complete